METQTNPLRLWGLGGALTAAVFATWLLIFPGLVAPYFSWDAEPRLSQVFIGAGYVFRTAFFLSIWREPSWYRVRWMYWGNQVFNAVLLLATFWHAEQFRWAFPISTGHLWLFLYLIEPVSMIYLAPRWSQAWAPTPATGGPLSRAFKLFLIVEATLLFAFGAILIINPDFANRRWPWELDPLDARIIAAWFWGWSVWAGTMAFAYDWDEIRAAAQVNMVFGLALLGTVLVFQPLFDPTRITSHSYGWGVALVTLVMAFFYWRQERARQSARAVRSAPAPST